MSGDVIADSRHLVSTDVNEAALALPQGMVQSLPGENMLFVTWIAFGEKGDGGFKTHNFHSVDMRSEPISLPSLHVLTVAVLFQQGCRIPS